MREQRVHLKQSNGLEKSRGRYHLKTLSVIVIMAITITLLSACHDIDPPLTYDLTVRNYCVGGMWTVDVYVNGRYMDDVTYSQTFPSALRHGANELRAVGSVSLARTHYVTSDITWVLCPSMDASMRDEEEVDETSSYLYDSIPSEFRHVFE